MKGFILAAGFGERLRPITDRIPKPLISVAGIPSICYSLALMRKNRITDVICNLHYRHGDIIDFFHRNRNFGFNMEFSIEQEILGTGGGLKKCQHFLKDDDFLLLNSDLIADLNIEVMAAGFKKAGNEGILSLSVLDEDKLPGTVSVENKVVADFNGMMNSDIPPLYDYMGAALLSPDIFKYLKPDKSCIVRTGFRILAEEKKLGYTIHDGYWFDIGTFEKLQQVESFMRSEGSYLTEEVKALLGDIM